VKDKFIPIPRPKCIFRSRSLGEASPPKLFVFNLSLPSKCCDSAFSSHCCHITWGLANIHNNTKMKIQCRFHFTRQWGCSGGKDCYLKINIFHIWHKHSCRLLCTALLSLDRLRLSSVFLLPVLFLVGQFNSLLLWVWSMCLMDWICNTIFPGQIGHCTVCTKVVVTYWPAP